MCLIHPLFRFLGCLRPGSDIIAANCQFICVSGTVQSAIRGLLLTQVQPLSLHLRHRHAFQARTSNITCAGELKVLFVLADGAGKTESGISTGQVYYHIRGLSLHPLPCSGRHAYRRRQPSPVVSRIHHRFTLIMLYVFRFTFQPSMSSDLRGL